MWGKALALKHVEICSWAAKKMAAVAHEAADRAQELPSPQSTPIPWCKCGWSSAMAGASQPWLEGEV